MLRARYRRIIWFFARLLAGFVVWDLVLPRVGLGGWARRTRPERLRRGAARFRALAIALGGVLIKVGQFMSARLDVLPVEVTGELAGLQDEVPAEQFERIRALAEAELGAPLSEKFASFEVVPLAAASLGQVHRARLAPAASDGSAVAEPPAVVVKVQRPDVERLIATDLAALRTVGRWLQRYRPLARRVDLPALLAEFTRILYQEIDYLAEGRNAETFAANFRGAAGVRVPGVVWTHTTRRVLALEDVYAIKITDYEAITAAGIDRAAVADRLFKTYLTQIFEHHFFHADPHPGNLFVRPLADGAWQLVFVDFGMVGHVPPNARAGLREAVIAVGTRDPARLVHAYQLLGVLLPHADLRLLERAEAKAFERFWGKDMAELRQIDMQEMHAFAREFRELIYTMPFQVPQDLILLGRTVAILSGMCTGLNPQFNVWTALEPFARRLVAEEMGSEVWLQELGRWLRAAAGLPLQAERVLGRLERGEVAVRAPEVTEHLRQLSGAVQRLAGSVVFAALLLAGVQVWLAGQPAPAALLMAGAGLVLAWLAWPRRPTG